jgi:carboxypeptidase Q
VTKPIRSLSRALLAVALVFFCALSAGAAKDKKEKTPATESAASAKDPNAVDWDAISRIRSEAFHHSHVMETLSNIVDKIGPRLTNSPNMRKANAWTRDQLASWGMENAHLEPWGPFGRGWSYEKSSIRMTAPDPAELLALPKAFTPGTDGVVKGKVMQAKIESKADFEKFRGKLKGMIVLLGEPRELKLHDTAFSKRFDDPTLAHDSEFEIPADRPSAFRDAFARRLQFAKDLNQFLEDEKPALVIEASRTPGDYGTIFVQGGGSYKTGDPVGAPDVVMEPEQYDRMWRLLDKDVPVEVEAEVKARFYDDDAYGYNTIAEIVGSDPKMKDEVVMIGGHLDSWHAGTGATDNGSGCAVMMEVMRILKSLDLKPRRTVRIGLWSGEEEGLLGSRGYVREHFGERAPSEIPVDKDLPDWAQRYKGPVTTKPQHGQFDVYFNFDEGTGKIRGIYMQENGAVEPIFKQWMEPFKDLGMTTLTMNNTGGSDHLSFDEVGLPGFAFIQDPVEYDSRTHHSNMDTYEHVQREDLMQASAIIASWVYQAAMRDEKLPRKAMPQRETPPPQKKEQAEPQRERSR